MSHKVTTIHRGNPSLTQTADVIEEKRQVRLRKAFSMATDIGLDDNDRHELAQMLPQVDKDNGGSWKDLNPMQLHDLITMMEGWVFINHMVQAKLD